MDGENIPKEEARRELAGGAHTASLRCKPLLWGSGSARGEWEHESNPTPVT
jgi:hypothetical protein